MKNVGGEDCRVYKKDIFTVGCVIETERLLLRKYKMDDLEALYEIMSDAETMQHYPAPFDMDRTKRWIQWNLDNYEQYGFGLWAVVLKETGEFIGDCGITIQNIDGEMLPEIGYHIHKKYWRRGYAKEAAQAVRDWVFRNTDYDAIYSYMKYTNVGSYSTAIANGMKKVKEYPDPKNTISYAYAITREEWKMIMDKYYDIKNRILESANSDDDIKAIVAIGSSTRSEVKADEYSDLDLFIVTTNVNPWFSGEYPRKFGNVSISFIEETLGGGKERRCIYDEDKDVDMIILTPEQFEAAISEGVAQWVMNRGYEVLYDSMNCTESLQKNIKLSVSAPSMSEEEFSNMVNDFYFHNIWAYKKLKRGELWSAKNCVDAYLKRYLLRMIELYSYKTSGADVWHEGRFIEKWADKGTLSELKECFAHYDKDDIFNALLKTHHLFARISRKAAELEGYEYPAEAEACAKAYLGIDQAEKASQRKW